MSAATPLKRRAMAVAPDQIVIGGLSSDRPGAVLRQSSLRSSCVFRSFAILPPGLRTSLVGWIKALCDERIAPALRLMHRETRARPGQVGELG